MLVNLLSTTMPNPKDIKSAMSDKFLTKEKFAEAIEAIVRENNVNYIDAIVQYCEQNNIEVESVSKLIPKPLKEKLRYDATELNYLKKTSRAKLPL